MLPPGRSFSILLGLQEAQSFTTRPWFFFFQPDPRVFPTNPRVFSTRPQGFSNLGFGQASQSCRRLKVSRPHPGFSFSFLGVTSSPGFLDPTLGFFSARTLDFLSPTRVFSADSRDFSARVSGSSRPILQVFLGPSLGIFFGQPSGFHHNLTLCFNPPQLSGFLSQPSGFLGPTLGFSRPDPRVFFTCPSEFPRHNSRFFRGLLGCC